MYIQLLEITEEFKAKTYLEGFEKTIKLNKTSNHYLVDTEKYNDLEVKNIQKDFKKAAPGDIKKAFED